MKKARKGGRRDVDSDGLSPLGRSMVAGADAFLEAMRMGEATEDRFTVRTVELQPEPRAFKPEDVKAVRGHVRRARRSSE
ncbi:MAG: hypothetical protein BGO49_29620 [Planctomycetales bacterium 71-10]|nr:MAG: hypothetical protein BGO49_29620 [Planctomycetales bacterium 71-10]